MAESRDKKSSEESDGDSARGSGSKESVVQQSDRIELLIGPRRSRAAKSTGVQPLSARSMQSAIAAIERQHGAEIVREIRPARGRKLKTLSTTDEATSIFKVHMNVDSALTLLQSAPPSIAVEVDAPLAYGQASASPVLSAILRERFGSPLGTGTQQARTVRLRVVGPDGESVPGAHVVLDGAAGFPQEGETNRQGNVELQLFGAGQQARSLFVQPKRNYWNRQIRTPSLSTDTINIVPLHSLSATVPGFPENAHFGWGQKLMGLDQLPDEFTGKGVKIAIIDSGADNSHPVLKHIEAGVDLTNDGDTASWTTDVIGHGSHCAGVITGQAADTAAIRGFAPEAEIHILKVFPGGQYSSLLDAIAYCIEIGVDVVNMSLGSGDTSDAVEQQLDDAIHNGIACIVAAGNSGGPVQYPARSPNVMAVAAIGMLNEFPPDSWDSETVVPSLVTTDGVFSPTFTCFGPEIAVAAPGVGIISTVPDDGFDPQSGTSMAAPHVTGLAALVLAHHPLFKGQLKQRDANRVAGLFQLIRSSSAALPFGPERGGVGVPRLFDIASAFVTGEEQPELASARPGGFQPQGAGVPQGTFTPQQIMPGNGGWGPFQIQPFATANGWQQMIDPRLFNRW